MAILYLTGTESLRERRMCPSDPLRSCCEIEHSQYLHRFVCNVASLLNTCIKDPLEMVVRYSTLSSVPLDLDTSRLGHPLWLVAVETRLATQVSTHVVKQAGEPPKNA